MQSITEIEMAYDKDREGARLTLKEQASCISKLESAVSAVSAEQLGLDATRLWFIVNPDGEIDEATGHQQEEGAKALLVAAKSRRQVRVCRWEDFESYGWTCKEFILIPGYPK